MTYRAVVEPNECSAHGDCVEIAPDVFRLDDDVAVVIGTGTPEKLLEAAETCPAVAISVVDETGETVFP